MALFSLSPSVCSSWLKQKPYHHIKFCGKQSPSLGRKRLINSIVNEATTGTVEGLSRRTGNHHPNLWDEDSIKPLPKQQSFEAHYYNERVKRLTAEVKGMFNAIATADIGNSRADNAYKRLVLVDKIERLAIDRHFKKEITEALDYVYRYWKECRRDLNTTALGLRILRLHRYQVSSDVLGHFKAKDGQFLCSTNQSDEEKIRSILNLYRVSLIAFPDEKVMEEAKAFATTYLNQALQKSDINSNLSREITFNLDYGWYSNLPRIEGRNYIDIYGENSSWANVPDNKTLLCLAKLDFNMMQSLHQRELETILRWWKESGLSKVTFARHRHVEYFALVCAYCVEAKYSAYRISFVKACALATIIDDMFDTYGTIEELKLFKVATERWDHSPLDSLPESIKIVYNTFYDALNEDAREAEKTQGRDTLSYARQCWEAYMDAMMKEAQWLAIGYIPTLEEYLQNSIASCGNRVTFLQPMLTLDAVLPENILPKVDYPSKFAELLSLVLRLKGDTRTFKAEAERGELASGITCYMRDHPESKEEDALDYLKALLDKLLKELNWEYLKPDDVPTLSKDHTFNVARAYQLLYRERDGFSITNKDIKDLVIQILIEPVAM